MMREPPPRRLIELLERLGLASEAQVRQASRRVHRLARELPLFESVWVDALAQSRAITAYQAQELKAGRGESLRVGPYVVDEPLRWPGYASAYLAHERHSRGPVHLIVVDRSSVPHGDVLGAIEALAGKLQTIAIDGIAGTIAAGGEGSLRWIASQPIKGRTAAEWMVHHGRFTPEVVLEIARQMVAALAAMEKQGLCHGDISTHGMMLTADGRIVLMQPGLRAILRAEEGYAQGELAPEVYDYLAPERIVDGTPPMIASDLFSCGCVWWHLLTGRPPLPGGNSLAKLRASQSARIVDVRRWTPETPVELAAAITACVAADCSRRPESMSRLAATLGPSTQAGRAALARSLSQTGRPLAAWVRSSRKPGRTPTYGPAWLVAATSLLAVLGMVFAPMWRERPSASTLAEVSTSARPHTPSLPSARPQQAQGDGAPAVVANASSSKPTSVATPSREGIPGLAIETPSVQPGPKPTAGPGVAVSYETTAPEVLTLAGGSSVPSDTLRLLPGMVVRCDPSQRAQVVVPSTGLVVGVDDVRFENVDFVLDPAISATVGDHGRALVHLQSSRIEFSGCRFDVAAGEEVAAISWTHPVRRNDSPLSLPSGRIRMNNCVLLGVAVGLDCRTQGAIAIHAENVLCVKIGAMVRLDHFPSQDESVAIGLSQATLRETGPLVECRYESVPKSPCALTVRGNQCVLSLDTGASLFLFVGADSPTRLLENVQWTGQGSLLTPGANVAVWQPEPGRIEVPDDTGVAIAGLVRSEVGFAGNSVEGNSASCATRWQVPLRSADPPGIDAERLPSRSNSLIRRGSI